MIKKIIFKIILVFSLLIIITGCDEITDPTIVEDPTEFPEFGDEPVWSDEFNDTSSMNLDSSKWGYDLGYGGDGWGNDEWQQYTNNQENVRVENGNLIISAVWDSANYAEPGKRDGSITSARINTKDKFSFKYGKIQARIKVPTGKGMWPAFWMLGDNFDGAGWPYCGEIDIMEVTTLYHDANTTLSTLHWWDDDGGYHAYEGDHIRLANPLSDDYHIYEVEWDDQRIKGKIDGITYFTKVIDPTLMNEFLRDFFIIFNVAVGGSLGGAPDVTTEWPQEMFVDWVRVYQAENAEDVITSFGLFTDETPVDTGITVGLNAEIYVWENTLTAGSIAPYEGDNVISWATTGVGWFGGGISSNVPEDLSGFEEGNLKFMIKIPADVTFNIGITDIGGEENYVTFPANQAAYNLQRNGEWEQAIIPVSELKGNVDLSLLSYELAILEENGAQCEFALDDIYYDGGGATAGSVSFDADVYSFDASMAEIAVMDEAAANTTVSVSVNNGTETISIDVILNENGEGTGTLNFGATDDDTDTIDISSAVMITVVYLDAGGTERSDSATIENTQAPSAAAPVPAHSAGNVISIYSDSYTNIAGINFNPGWGQTTIVTFEEIGGNEMMKYDIFNYQGTELASAQDLSGMEYMHVDMWTSDATVVKVTPISQSSNENLVSLTPINSGSWNSYDIPVGDFAGVSMSDIFQLKFDCQDGVTPSTIYLDNIYFYAGGMAATAGIYSESHTSTMIPYSQIINSADWSGNSVVPDEMSTAVPPVDGTYVLSATYETGGHGWGGIAFNFGSADITSYSTLKFSIDTSNMPTLAYFGIKLEDNSTGSTEVNLLTYTPVTSGNWAKYELPLSDFPGANLADLKYIGLWNPKDAGDALLFDTIYFDDIYLEE